MADGAPRRGPDPNSTYPLPGTRRVCFLKNVIKKPRIIVGEYTYFDDPDDPSAFDEKNVLYHYDFHWDKLVIGKFCTIASGVRFIMSGANHKIDAFTTYPFAIFGQGWEAGLDELLSLPSKGDTVVGNDVWLGRGVTIMPGVKIGDGAIVAAESVVTADVPPYAVVGGNPAQIIRKRFADDVIELLMAIRWWDWDIERITRSISVLGSNDVERLREIAG